VCLSEEDSRILRNEPAYVRKRYRAVARTLAPDLVRIYVHWYNNGKRVRTTGCYREERYSGTRDLAGTRGS